MTLVDYSYLAGASAGTGSATYLLTPLIRFPEPPVPRAEG
jgi:hypothetical protein